MYYKNKCSKNTDKLQKIIIDKLIDGSKLDDIDKNKINDMLQNTILQNYNFQYDNPIHRGMLLTILVNYDNNYELSCNIYIILEKTKIYIHDFCK